MNLTELRELLTFITFVFGAFKSTPAGRARRELIRKRRSYERWRKARLRYIKGIRKDWSKKSITRTEYDDLIRDFDRDYPKPK